MANSNNSRAILLVFVCYLVFNYNKKCVTYQYTHLIRQFGLSQQNAGKPMGVVLVRFQVSYIAF